MIIWYCCNFHSCTRWKLYYTEWTLTVFMVVWVAILSNEKAQRFYLSNIIFKWQTPSCVKLRNNWRPNNKIPAFYKCYVDETLSTMPDVETAAVFLSSLNNSHPSIDFRMELEENRQLRFLGMEIIRSGCWLDIKVYRKPMDTGLLLHYHSHMDGRQRSLLNTMLNRALKLSSTWGLFHQECECVKEIFSQLCYPDKLVQSTIR